ncbi:MAG: recombinase family protein [Clostridium sp.]|nr:recombinase family protein [Clostridium sp.]
MRLGKEVGYARVSSREQNLDRQLIALRKFVPDEMIVTDRASGKDFNRPGYQSLKIGIGKLVKGDVLYIKSLDRFSRNKEEAKKELQYFSDLGVRVKILDLPSTMTDISEGQEWIIEMINNILIEVLTSISENERMTIRSRQAEGLAAMPIDEASGKKVSKKTGQCIGRPTVPFPSDFGKYYGIWRKKEITAVAAMKALNLKRSSFYKLVRQYEEENSAVAAN